MLQELRVIMKYYFDMCKSCKELKGIDENCCDQTQDNYLSALAASLEESKEEENGPINGSDLLAGTENRSDIKPIPSQ